MCIHIHTYIHTHTSIHTYVCIPLPEPVESSQNGIWTSPLKLVELHFAPDRYLCGPVSTQVLCLKIQNMSAGNFAAQHSV